MSNKAFETILEHKIVAIVRGFEPETVVEMAKAYCANGIHCVEITFDQTNPEKQYLTAQSIRMVKEALGDAMCVGAGTVMTVEQVRMAAEAGAEYMISPNVDEDVIKETKRLGKLSMFGGETQRVKIRFENKMLGTVLDRFGRLAVVYTKEDEKHFVLTADVKVSEQFYGWLLGFGRKAQLVYPATAVEDFKAYLNTVMGLYESC